MTQTNGIENGKDIPEVNENVAIEAGKIVTFALLNDISIEIDYDVLGGVAIYLCNEFEYCPPSDREEKHLWISLMNSGFKTILDSDKNVISQVVDYDLIMDYLFSD